MITDRELKEMKATLEAEAVDDPEDILVWFAINGPDLIDELLGLREASYQEFARGAERVMAMPHEGYREKRDAERWYVFMTAAQNTASLQCRDG